MRVLVTGASGLIGKHCISALQQGGDEVIALYRKRGPDCPDTVQGKIILDLRERDARDKIRRIKPDVIVHCAACVPEAFFGESVKELARENTEIDSVITDLCADKGCKVIYLSSTSVYGWGGDRVDELSPIRPAGEYAEEKYRTERRLLDVKKENVIFRLSSPYGIQQGKRTVLYQFIKNGLLSEPILYYGRGERRQDFIAAEDVASAVVNSIKIGHVQGVFNMASGRPVSMKELAHLVISLIPNSKSKVLPAGNEDPEEGYRADFDISKARELLQWRPRISLESGIHKLINHYAGTK